MSFATACHALTALHLASLHLGTGSCLSQDVHRTDDMASVSSSDDGSSTVMSWESIVVGTPRMEKYELFHGESVRSTSSPTGSFISNHSALEASPVAEKKQLFHLLERITAAEAKIPTFDGGVNAISCGAPPTTPVTDVAQVSPEDIAVFFKALAQGLKKLPGKVVDADLDRHHLGFDRITFPTLDFDTPLVGNPLYKVKTVGKPGGGGHSGFCISFKEIAQRQANVVE